MIIELNIADFRASFPEFSDSVEYPDSQLEMIFETSSFYVSTNTYGCLSVKARTHALYLMMGHLLKITDLVISGNAPQFVKSASEDGVSVSIQEPPQKDQWQWWMNLTPYGQQLLALLQAASVGGFYVGGRAELSAFRKARGVF